MRNGLFTTMWCANGLGPDVMVRLKRHRKQTFIRGRLCSQCGGISKVLCFSSSYQVIKQSIEMCIVGNWTVWTNPSSKNVQNSLIVKAWCFITTMQDHTQVWSPVKNCWSLDGMCCHIHPTRQILRHHISMLMFRALQNSLRGITFNSDEAVNQHLVQFFADKDRSFYERGIMKLTEIWQKVIEQSGQYIIDWSLFFIWINDFELLSKNASWLFRQPIILRKCYGTEN